MRILAIRRALQERSPVSRGLAAALLIALLAPLSVVGSATSTQAATVENGMSLSLDNGQAVAGMLALTASDEQGEGPASISVDGVDLEASVADRPANLQFEAHGWDAGNYNTFVINGEHEVVPMVAYASWAAGVWTIPISALKPGLNTVELRSGSQLQALDPRPGVNDDFRIRNVALWTEGGRKIMDPSVPADTYVLMGDAASTDPKYMSYTWNITLPPARLALTSSADWDADAAGPGDHVVTATSADGTRTASATVHVDGAAGTVERIVLTPPQDPSTAQSFTWRTESATTDGAVAIRRLGDTEWTTVTARANEVLTSGAVSTRTHSATVTGLDPATEYEYSVGSAAGQSEIFTFTTAGEAGAPFTFLYFGDAQNDLTEKWAPVVTQAFDAFPDAVGTVNAGDLINESRNDSEWTEWFEAMDGYSQTTNVIAAPGNHEYVGDSFLKNWKATFEYDLNGPSGDGADGTTEAEIQEAAYRRQIATALEETAYYTDYQGVRFITLNASKDESSAMITPDDLPPCAVGCPDPTQLWLDMQAEWLDDLLSNNPNKWAVAVFHQPVFSTAVDRDEPEIRDTWLPVFQRNDIDLVLMGHDHTYARGFVNSDATATPGVTTGPVYAVSVSGPKYYEQQPANDNVWTRNGATQVADAGHTSTFQGITVDGDTLRYEAIVAAKWDEESTTDVPVGGVLDAFTITKYDSGAKFVTEDGVAIPEDPGTPEEPDESGLSFDIPNGSTRSGITSVTATDSLSTERPKILVDGVEQASSAAGAPARLTFQAHGWESNTLNTFVINGEHEIVPLTRYYDWASGSWEIPASVLRPGVNTVELKTASALEVGDPRDNANDDFRIRNVQLRLPDGTTVRDTSLAVDEYILMGDAPDGPAKNMTYTWNITVPEDSLVTATKFVWDTTTMSPGAHELTVESADETRASSITVYVDNYEDVTLNLTDGDVLNSLRPITVTTDVEPTISVDGNPLPVELRRRVIDPVFTFEGDGFQPAAAADSIWINGELYRVLRSGYNANGYSQVRVEIPWEELRPGTNVIRLRSGSSTDPEGADVDVFTTRNTKLEFPGDRFLTDPKYTPTQILNYNNNSKFHDFTFVIPDSYETVYQADWDTELYADGEHTVEVTREDGRSSAQATVTLDNSGPVVDVNAPEISRSYVKESFVIDVQTADAHEIRSVEYAIDGVAVENGEEITSDDLVDGGHVFTVRAEDVLGNVSEHTVPFTMTGNYPFDPSVPEPAHQSINQSTTKTRVQATVEDPTGEAMDVEAFWAHRGDFAQGENTATQGSSTSATPERAAGAVVDSEGRGALGSPDGDTLRTVGEGEYPFQQFEIDVPSDLRSSTFEVEWVGSVPDAQRAALSVWNQTTGAWDLLDEGTGANLTLSGEASVDDSVHDGTATIMVQDIAATVIAENGDDAVWAWISDTQFYAQNDPSVYEAQVQWVLDNRESEGIGYATHTGDIVNQREVSQWEAADKAQRIWDDAGFPYGLVPGNHDIDADGSYTSYQKYFGEDRYADNPWHGGSHDNNVQHYDVLSTPEADYLVVYVDWSISQSDIDWANEVIGSHPDYNVIIATHQYFNNQGEYMNPAPQIWDQIIAPNPNVDAVLSGHVGVWLNSKNAGGDREVIEVMADYQSAPNNGDGWMRTISFDAEAQTFSNRTFSVTHDRTWWVNDAMENFTVPMSLEAPERFVATDYVGVTTVTGESIGSLKNVPSGTRVGFDAGVLEPETRYSWVIEATDTEGFTTRSPIWDFTTNGRVSSMTTASVDAVQLGESPIVTVTVSADAAVDGTIEIYEGSTLLASGELTEGQASIELPNTLAAGTHELTVNYTGSVTVTESTTTVSLEVLDATEPGMTVERVAGDSRFTTAVEVSKLAYPDGADVVFVANGVTYPDALSAGPAAAFAGGPLLLVAPTAVPAEVTAELARLAPDHIVVVGGAPSVSDAAYSHLESLPGTIERVAGDDRFETSRMVAERVFGELGADTAYISTGLNFPDALTGGAAAGVFDAPVILVPGAGADLDSATADLLKSLGADTVKVLGSNLSVSDGIVADLGAIATTQRLEGPNRYDTGRAINADAFESAEHVLLATGEGFPDALSGSAWAAAAGLPMFVVPGTCVPQGVLDDIEALGTTHVTLLGGTPSLSEAVESLTVCG